MFDGTLTTTPDEGAELVRLRRLYDGLLDPRPTEISAEARGDLEAMALYGKADYAGARDGLVQYLSRKGGEKSAYMYLASCYLALGEPYEAELQLDHLERSNTLQYNDQVEWYSVLCLLCSDQLSRALKGAEAIAEKKAHTYRTDAIRLVKELGAQE